MAVGLIASSAALLRAGVAPAAALPQVGAIRSDNGQDPLAYVGLAAAGIGLVFLLRGLFFYGALMSLAIVAAGLLAGLELLVARGVVPEGPAAKLRPLAVPVGLTCAAAAVLHLFIAGCTSCEPLTFGVNPRRVPRRLARRGTPS